MQKCSYLEDRTRKNVIINLFGETAMEETTKLYSPNINVGEAFKFLLNISISIL